MIYIFLQLKKGLDRQCLQSKQTLEYKTKTRVILANPMTDKEISTSVDLIIHYETDMKRVQEEILVYDTLGMVSQLGGVISLFIGISFFSLIDYMLDFVKNL